MGVSVIGPIILSLLGTAFCLFFFWFYGAFKLPKYAILPILFMFINSIVQSFGLIPYDAALFKEDNQFDAEGLLIVFQVCYWISQFLSWLIMPVFAAILTYNYGLTQGKRIWYAIRYNILFWVIMISILGVGLLILLITKHLTISNIPPLGIACSNLYGLVVMCLLLGYGFVSIPRILITEAQAYKRLKKYLFNLSIELQSFSQSYENGKETFTACEKAVEKVRNFQQKELLPNLKWRMEEIKQLMNDTDFQTAIQLYKKQPEEIYQKLNDVDWNNVFRTDMEVFLETVEKARKSLVDSYNFLQDTVNRSEVLLKKSIQEQDQPIKMKLNFVFRLVCAILYIILAGISFFDQLMLIIKPSYSLGYNLYTLKINPLVGMFCFTAPTLAFSMFTTGWCLTQIRIGTYYRFINHGSNDNTLYLFVLLFVRIAPTIGYNYLMQIQGNNCMYFQVMSVMTQVPFLGVEFVTYLPILMFIVFLVVLFNIHSKIIKCFHIKSLSFDVNHVDLIELDKGKDILKFLRPNLGAEIQQLDYWILANNEEGFGKSNGYGECELNDNLIEE